MKKIIFFLMLLFTISVKATTYYVANDGDDINNDGKSEQKPWRTISKVNTSMQDGDKFLFKRGSTFFGALKITKLNITIDAWGDPALTIPILNGTSPVNSSWTQEETNLYYCSYTNTTNFFVSGNPQIWARTPDSDNLHFESSTGKTIISADKTIYTITDDELPLPLGDWTGAEIVIKMADYWYGKFIVEDHVNKTLTISSSLNPVTLPATLPADDGYFIQSHKNCVNSENEWTYYNNKIYYYCSNPTLQNSSISGTYTFGIEITKDNSYVNNLKLYSYSNSGIKIGTNNTNILKCTIEATGQRSINIVAGTTNTNITDCIIKGSDSYGIYIAGSTVKCENNIIENIGLIPGKAASGQGQYCGIHLEGNSATLIKNSIKGIGYNGIDIKKYITGCSIQYNKIENCCEILTDGGSIYTNSNVNSNTISNNLIINNWPEKSTTGIYGIYIDDNSSNFILENNTICNCPTSIFIHNSNKINISGNTTYSCKNGLLLKRDDIGTTNVTGCTINGNSFINKSENSDYTCIKVSSNRTDNDILSNNTNEELNNHFNNNYLISPFNTNVVINEDKTITPAVTTNLTIEDLNNTANRLNNKPVPIVWQDIFGDQTFKDKYVYFNINEDPSNLKVVNLNATYRDKNGEFASSSITIPALSSEILFPVCVNNLTIPWDISESAFTWDFRVKNEITSQKKITSSAKFFAETITLSEGFNAVEGCNFQAKGGEPCNDSYQSASGYLKSARIQNDMQTVDNKSIDYKPELTNDEEPDVLVYPNPSSGNVTIKLLHVETGKYSVYNSLGIKIKDGQLFNTIENIDLSSCSKGIFLIKIKTTAGVYVKYLIVK